MPGRRRRHLLFSFPSEVSSYYSFFSFFLLILIFFRPLSSQNPNPNPISLHYQIPTLNLPTGLPLLPFDCAASPQASPVFAARVEGLHYPFLYSLADFGSLPEKPHKNIVRMIKGKPFCRSEISSTIQEFRHGSKPTDGIVIDVGANVGMATFAAAAMGFRLVAFEPVFENLQRICDGVFLNRFWGLVVIFEAAASDRLGNITLHKKCSYPNINGCCTCSQDNLMRSFFNSHGQLSELDFSKVLDKEICSGDLCEEMLVNADIFEF